MRRDSHGWLKNNIIVDLIRLLIKKNRVKNMNHIMIYSSNPNKQIFVLENVKI